MYIFGKRSLQRLSTTHPDIQRVIKRAMSFQYMDISVICGNRSTQTQGRLYAKGRSEPGNIVTNIDGVTRKSEHNYEPSLAIDVAPYPNLFESTEDEWLKLSVCIQIAANLEGVNLLWGDNFESIIDKPHWQLEGESYELVRNKEYYI